MRIFKEGGKKNDKEMVFILVNGKFRKEFFLK